MKKLGLIALCGLFAGISFSQSDLENQRLKGKVKSLETKTYRTTNKRKSIKILSIKSESKSEFNKDGFLLSARSRFTSDSLGTGDWSRTENKLNNLNQPSKTMEFENDELLESISYEYNNQNNLVSKSFYNESGKLLKSEKIDYNSDGLIARKTWLNGTGIEDRHDTTIYNKNKEVVEYHFIKGVYTISKYMLYPKEYSKKTTELNANRDTNYVYLVEYNDKNELLVYETFDSKGKTIKKNTFKYNKKGDLILEKSFDDNGNKNDLDFRKYKYDYDDKGNWIKRTEFVKGGNSVNMTIREITYFD